MKLKTIPHRPFIVAVAMIILLVLAACAPAVPAAPAEDVQDGQSADLDLEVRNNQAGALALQR